MWENIVCSEALGQCSNKGDNTNKPGLQLRTICDYLTKEKPIDRSHHDENKTSETDNLLKRNSECKRNRYKKLLSESQT